MTTDRTKLRQRLAEGTPRPWHEDDGHIQSSPLREQRHAVIMRRMNGEDLPHPDDVSSYADSDYPFGYVAHCEQRLPNFEADAHLIVDAVNGLLGLLDELDEVEADRGRWVLRSAIEDMRAGAAEAKLRAMLGEALDALNRIGEGTVEDHADALARSVFESVSVALAKIEKPA